MKSKIESLADSYMPSLKGRTAKIAKRKEIPFRAIQYSPQVPGEASARFREAAMKDLCNVFTGYIRALVESSSLILGVPLTRNSLRTLPRRPGICWLLSPPDKDHRLWHLVFVNYTQDIYKCWNAEKNSMRKRGRAANCKLNWYVVKRETGPLVAQAFINRLKPAWNPS